MAFAIDIFRTQRLVFRNLEPQDDDFVVRIGQDPVSVASVEITLQRPRSAAQILEQQRKVFGDIEGHLLNVLICLPQTPTNESMGNEGAYKDNVGRTVRATPENSKPIGMLHLSAGPRKHHRSTMMGIQFEQAYTGQGYGTEAITWAMRWAFVVAGMHRFELGTFGFNEGAIRLYERLGFKREGTKRGAFWMHGKWHDEILYGMLEEEWRERYGVEKTLATKE